MPVQTINTTLELDDVHSILVSDIQPDTDSDYYVRILTIFTQSGTTLNRTPDLIIRLLGGSQANNDKTELEIETPSLEF